MYINVYKYMYIFQKYKPGKTRTKKIAQIFISTDKFYEKKEKYLLNWYLFFVIVINLFFFL